MKLDEMIDSSRKKNEKYDCVDLSVYRETQFYGALNLKAVKEGTGIGGSFANWFFEMCRVGGFDLIEARKVGNKLQQLALDSKHDGSGAMMDTVWYKICQLKKFKGSRIELEIKINEILSGIDVNSDSSDVCDYDWR